MKHFLIFLFLLLFNNIIAQTDTSKLNIISWNIQNFGKTKSQEEDVMNYITSKIKIYDIVCVQEVSTSEFGSQAVAKLDELLDRTGTSWDYVVSNPTSGKGSERYAFLFKKNRVKLKSSELEKSLMDSINREPFKSIFIFKNLEYYLFNLHLVPTDKHPEIEAQKLGSLNKIYAGKKIILMGDFNLSQSNIGFNQLKKFTKPTLIGRKTSLKMKEDGKSPMNMEYDNFFISSNINLTKSDVIEFWKDFKELKLSRRISDHCPIYCIIK